MAKSIKIGKGPKCPNCSIPMNRKGHPEGWKPKPKQPYYFRYWDVCKECHRVQHYEVAKVRLEDDGPRFTPRESSWEGTPPPYEGAPPWE